MTASFRSLVVDDEQGIRFFLQQTLEREGHAAEGAASGEEALELLRTEAFDLILLDLKLGGRVDGLRVLEAVKWRWPNTAVVILTAHASLDSALAAIREGVDGYLVKPVEPSQIRQAVREALDRRRTLTRTEVEAGDDGETLRSGPLWIDLKKHVATVSGEELDLTPREFQLLAHLVQNASRVVEPPELVRVVQGYECEDLNEARDIIKWYIHHLRGKVEPDPSEPRYILNVRGVGYRWGS